MTCIGKYSLSLTLDINWIVVMEEKRIRYPIGIQTFRNIVEGGYLYIDKTGFVHDLATNYSYVFLSRPRRFGKSLLSSTIHSYFAGEA